MRLGDGVKNEPYKLSWHLKWPPKQPSAKDITPTHTYNHQGDSIYYTSTHQPVLEAGGWKQLMLPKLYTIGIGTNNVRRVYLY